VTFSFAAGASFAMEDELEHLVPDGLYDRVKRPNGDRLPCTEEIHPLIEPIREQRD
jgi:hypothetical protein